MDAFELQRPESLHSAVNWLAREPRARVLAGGTDLLPNLRRGIEQPSMLIDLGRVAGWSAIEANDEGLTLGAGVRLAQLATDARVLASWPVLAQAAGTVAGPSHRSVATIGGNLCLDTRCVYYNQSEWWRAANDYCLKRGGDRCHVAPTGNRCHAAFSGDVAPALLVLNATVELVSAQGARRLPLAELYRDDGAAHLQLRSGELLWRIHVPAPAAGSRAAYRKARVRGAIDFPLAGVALSASCEGDRLMQLQVALTGTNSQPILIDGLQDLLGRPVDDESVAGLGKRVRKQCSPVRTTATAANYRRQVAAALAQRLLRELATRTGNASG